MYFKNFENGGEKMKEKPYALWIGRANPPHQGHLQVMKDLLKEFHLVIGLGSCFTIDKLNPFYDFERMQMIGWSLIKDGIKISEFEFISLPDFYDDERWFKFIVAWSKFKRVKAVISGNNWVKDIFAELLPGMKVLRPKRKINISSTLLREFILKGRKEQYIRLAAPGVWIYPEKEIRKRIQIASQILPKRYVPSFRIELKTKKKKEILNWQKYFNPLQQIALNLNLPFENLFENPVKVNHERVLQFIGCDEKNQVLKFKIK